MKFKNLLKNYQNVLISSLGAFLCIFLIAYFNSVDETNIWLIPPFGASLVLVMAVHDSPLAQPSAYETAAKTVFEALNQQ